MNRVIKFRALREDGQGWIFGMYFKTLDAKHRIVNFESQEAEYVIPETAGQFTGFTADKRKKSFEKEVYEGDVFRETEENDLGDKVNYYVVMWIWQRGAFCMVNIDHYLVMSSNDLSEDSDYRYIFDDPQLYDFAIDIGALAKVGNIHEGGFLNE